MITTMTPAAENIRGTSALPFHLLKGLRGTNYCPPSPLKGEHNQSLQFSQAHLKGGSVIPSPSPEEGEAGMPQLILHKERKLQGEDVDIFVYSFNNNGLSSGQIGEVERELGVTIKTVPLPWWFRFVFKFHLLFVRLFLKYPIHHYIKLPQKTVNEIVTKQPDLIWVYGAEWSRVTRQFAGFKRIHTMPDSEALYYYRMLGQRFVTRDFKRYWRCALMYPKFLALERGFPIDRNILYHLVGEEDANFLRMMNPGIRAAFIRHPHYEVAEPAKEIRFHQPKIRLLVAGQYNLYMQQTADEIIQYVASPPQSPLKRGRTSLFPSIPRDNRPAFIPLKEEEANVASTMVLPPLQGRLGEVCYSITFLGKGWERHVGVLRGLGYEVEHIPFAPDYLAEVCKHDIQITPITIGTGTKGKVLDALANGLLVLGTPYAMENIAVEHGESCMVWRTPSELLEILWDIPTRVEHYERMAEAGREAVLTHHNREKIACELFM